MDLTAYRRRPLTGASRPSSRGSWTNGWPRSSRQSLSCPRSNSSSSSSSSRSARQAAGTARQASIALRCHSTRTTVTAAEEWGGTSKVCFAPSPSAWEPFFVVQYSRTSTWFVVVAFSKCAVGFYSAPRLRFFQRAADSPAPCGTCLAVELHACQPAARASILIYRSDNVEFE